MTWSLDCMRSARCDRRNGQTHSQMIWMIGTLSWPMVQEARETILRAWQLTDDQINSRLESFDPEFIRDACQVGWTEFGSSPENGFGVVSHVLRLRLPPGVGDEEGSVNSGSP
jgi:hypothetical protein